jgi:scyllo-inositol 2-dehydrogenase (NADP+)
MKNHRIVIIGLGNQGKKRKRLLKSKLTATIDPYVPEATYKSTEELENLEYDSVFLCTPDNVKSDLIVKYLDKKKHILVEKPILFSKREYEKIIKLVKKTKTKLYVAFNHRFEPSIIELKKRIQKNQIGKIYFIEILYSNGTARLVKDSKWRDKGLGVIPDLMSHIIDMFQFWFPNHKLNLVDAKSWKIENNSPDRAIIDFEIISGNTRIPVRAEVNLLSWKNEFRCKVYGSKGSIKLEDFCKWGISTFSQFIRVLPSGVPSIEIKKWKQKDPTWEAEEKFFKNMSLKDSLKNIKDAYLNSEFINIISRDLNK